MKLYRGVEVWLHSFLVSSLHGVRSQLHAEAAFTLGQIPRYLFHRSLSGPNTLSRHFGEEKTLLSLSGFEVPIVRPDRINFVQCCHYGQLLNGLTRQSGTFTAHISYLSSTAMHKNRKNSKFSSGTCLTVHSPAVTCTGSSD